VTCLMTLIFTEKFRICLFVQMFYCVDIVNVRSVSKLYCLDLFACVCMMSLCGRCSIMVHLPNFSLVTIDVLNCSSGLNVVTVSLSCFLLLACQVSALSYIIVIMCLISLGLLVLIPLLFTCWSCLQDNACLCIVYYMLL